MDGQRFDSLVGGIGETRSRRGVLGLLGGSLAALGLRSAGAQFEAQDCRGERQTCKRDTRCCGGDRTVCDQISRDCTKRRLKGETRCCGIRKQRCFDSCDCCNPFSCIEGRCQRGVVGR